jgi:uncharacterized protein YcaQ
MIMDFSIKIIKNLYTFNFYAMDRITLTPEQARKIILHAAGLWKRAPFGKGKEAVYKFIDHLGFLQIDSNSVVERAHHHVIATRVPGYQPEWIYSLQGDGKVYEFWTFATGYMPMHAYRFSLPVHTAFDDRYEVAPAETTLQRKILDRIGREGPLMARDFENDRTTKSTGWWDWRPSKRALEHLHLSGKLITLRKKDFQKVYDLPENVLPIDLDLTPPTEDEFTHHAIYRALKSLGVASLKDIAYTCRFVKMPWKTAVQQLVDTGKVCAVDVTGLKGGPYYMLPEYRKKSITLSGDVFILSPFDILNVLRHRLRDFFDFDYQVECFVPEAKRKYGYFSLPILIGDKFVARMDSKADRKKRTLQVNNLHFESVKLTKAMIADIGEAIQEFAKFNQCEAIVLLKCNDKAVLKTLRQQLSA